jgi:GAF domain-containing protein
MTRVPKSPNERPRLRVVDNLNEKDLSTSAFFDAVVVAAAGLVGVPMSAVTIVGSDVVAVVASCGMLPGDTLRGDSLCAHTILGEEPFVVSDTRKDPRFWANPCVVGPPYVRFYAGFPLVVALQAIGALCVMDDRPRQLSAGQLARLTVLAAGAAARLALASTSELGDSER